MLFHDKVPGLVTDVVACRLFSSVPVIVGICSSSCRWSQVSIPHPDSDREHLFFILSVIVGVSSSVGNCKCHLHCLFLVMSVIMGACSSSCLWSHASIPHYGGDHGCLFLALLVVADIRSTPWQCSWTLVLHSVGDCGRLLLVMLASVMYSILWSWRTNVCSSHYKGLFLIVCDYVCLFLILLVMAGVSFLSCWWLQMWVSRGTSCQLTYSLIPLESDWWPLLLINYFDVESHWRCNTSLR